MDHPDLLAHHILNYHPIIYVGKSYVNHSHRARLIPLWTSFAARFPLRYPHDPRRGAGQKISISSTSATSGSPVPSK